jgi:hypothetical protein
MIGVSNKRGRGRQLNVIDAINVGADGGKGMLHTQ